MPITINKREPVEILPSRTKVDHFYVIEDSVQPAWLYKRIEDGFLIIDTSNENVHAVTIESIGTPRLREVRIDNIDIKVSYI
mgnify:CR=1 FL=1